MVDSADYTKEDQQSKAYREARTARHLHEMELHTTMPITDRMSVMKVIGGWIYYNHLEKWASFVPQQGAKMR